jgi:hypothetical protein
VDLAAPFSATGLEKELLREADVESSGEVLLAHASLYVLAEKWGANSLNLLVLSKLHQTLSTLRLDASRFKNIECWTEADFRSLLPRKLVWIDIFFSSIISLILQNKVTLLSWLLTLPVSQ